MRNFGLLLILTLMVSVCAAQMSKPLPCEVTDFALAADGSGLWFECSNVVYWLSSASNAPVKIASAEFKIDLQPAPRGSQTLLSIPGKSRPNEVVLYYREKRIKELPISPNVMAWSADSQKLYIESGPSTGDAVTGISVYDLATGSSKRQKLRVPTETLLTCASTGHVYSTTPVYPGFKGSTVEYTGDLQFIKVVAAWNGARFSATCSYVASESEFHDPIAWSIYATKSGKVLRQFPDMNEKTGEFYSIIGWNPRVDSLLLREHFTAGSKVQEIYDVESNRVIQSIPGAALTAWSPTGESVVIASGKQLTWQRVAHRD